MQTLNGIFNHFKNYKAKEKNAKFEFINLVGEFASLQETFVKRFKLGKNYSTADIIEALNNFYADLSKRKTTLVIILDEFGKYLEYAAKNNPESELYFVQQLTEWVNNPKQNTLLIATLHQDFNTYAVQLSKNQKNEWEKVKGRLKDLPFNEPVEQLLYLASERFEKKFGVKAPDKNANKLFEAIKSAKVFPLRDYFDKSFANKLYPFDILSAAILTLSLQKYGQNERSLFSFIETNDHLGINEFDKTKGGFYNVAKVYDYLLNNYYSYITTKYNPHYTQWEAIRKGIEKIDSLFENYQDQKNAEDLLKLLGLTNLFASTSAKIDLAFVVSYAKYAMNIPDAEAIIARLERLKIIRYVKHNFRYTIFEGTDLDIEIAINEAGSLVEKISNIVKPLNDYFEFPFIPAKSSYYKRGTPRFFRFRLSEEPIQEVPEDDIDGFINLIFSEEQKAEAKVKQASAETKDAILFGYYKNTAEIKTLLFEIQKVKKVVEANKEDKVAIRELKGILEHYIKLLNHYVLDSLYADSSNIVWYFNGINQNIGSQRQFNSLLSIICDTVYVDTPVFKNEMVNKTNISGQIAQARKKLIERLFESINLQNLGFLDNEFPPEKSIYLTLLRETGLHRIQDGLGEIASPTNPTFKALWLAGENFIQSTKGKERSLGDFKEVLSTRPFKLKKGLRDFWLSIFLIAKSDEYALYEKGNYIPDLSGDILDLIIRRPEDYAIKAFDVAGVKLELFNRYRVFLSQGESSRPSNKLFIQTVKPFLSFYRELPEYAKITKRLDKKTLALRQVIANAKDPEKVFFEDFPSALGYSINDIQENPAKTEQFIKQLQISIRELRTSYDDLIDRVESFVLGEIIGKQLEFPEYRNHLIKRYKGLKTHLLKPAQKVFITRLQSPLDDKRLWISSVAQACIAKNLNAITDEEEAILYDKFKDLVQQLDNLTEISKKQVDETSEEIVKVEITNFEDGLKKNILRLPKTKSKIVVTQMNAVKKVLGGDKTTNMVTLIKILNELMNDGKES
jgi:hypothetical protein